MRSPQLSLLLVLSFLILSMGLILQSQLLMILILPLLSLFFLSSLYPSATMEGVRVRRKLSPRMSVGKGQIRVELEVTNLGRRRVEGLEVYDEVPEEARIEKGLNHFLLCLNPEETETLTYTLQCDKRGHHRVGPTRMRLRDSLGFHMQEALAKEVSAFSILPEVERIGVTELKPKRTGVWPGTISSRRSGEGIEFYGLRYYLPGDEPRRINWKASARLSVLVANEFESEKVTDIALVIEAGTIFGDNPVGRLIVESEVKAAASLAAHLLRQGNRVGLIAYGKTRTWVPLDFGKKQLLRIMNHLTSVKAGRTILSVDYVVNLLAPILFAPRSQVIVISPLTTPEIKMTVQSLAMMGYRMLVISPFLRGGHTLGNGDEAAEMALRILAIERENAILELSRISRVVDWDPLVPLSATLKGARRWRIKPQEPR
ncbi:MAG: DUF58 domain-containing protein [Nitrososphaeria archaeon]